MEMLHSFFAGIPSESLWSQAYVHRDGDVFFGVVIHTKAPVTEVASAGKEILAAAMAGSQAGLSREQFLHLFAQWNVPGINLVSLYVQGEKVLLFAQGETTVVLSRGGQEQVVLQGKEVGAYVEGEVEKGDYYLLATKAYTDSFPGIDTRLSPQDASDAAVARLHTLSESGGVCALFVQSPSEVKKEAVVSQKANVPSPKVTPLPLVVGRNTRSPISLHLPGVVHSPQGKKVVRALLVLIIVLVIVLGISWYVTVEKAKGVAKTLAPYQERYAKLTALGKDKKLDELSGLRELSRDLSARRKDAKEASLQRGMDQLLTKVDQEFSRLSGEKHLEKLHVFYDFRLIAADFVASSVAYDIPGKLAVFLDSSHSRILSLSLEKKEALQLSVDDKLKNPVALAVENRKAYVLGDGGVMELSLPLDTMGSVVVTRDSTWVHPKFVDTFGTNTYVFDTGARNILKYDLQNPGASPSGWLRGKEGLEFEAVTSLRIDGAVWLGTNAGKVFHFVQGVPSAFVYKDVLDTPSSSVYVYTSKDSEKLYVLDPRGKRLLVVGKDGGYQEAVVSDDFATATGVVVDETSNKAYVLSGSLVYEVEL